MNRKKPAPERLRKWQANRPHYENFVVPEDEGMVGPAEDDVQDVAKDRNGRLPGRRLRKPKPPKSTD
jgi:hypothetical protein